MNEGKPFRGEGTQLFLLTKRGVNEAFVGTELGKVYSSKKSLNSIKYECSIYNFFNFVS